MRSSFTVQLPKKSEWKMCLLCGKPRHFELPIKGESLEEWQEQLGETSGFACYSGCVFCGYFWEGYDEPEKYDAEVETRRHEAGLKEMEAGGRPHPCRRWQEETLAQYANAVG